MFVIGSSLPLKEIQASTAHENAFGDRDGLIPSLPGTTEVMSGIPGPNL